MKFPIRVFDGVEWKVATITDEEVTDFQAQHDSWSKTILDRCVRDAEDKNLIPILFDKRCPTFMEFLKTKLEERAVYLLNSSQKRSYRGDKFILCPYCRDENGKPNMKLMKGYNKKYKFYCGKCRKFAQKWSPEELKLRVSFANDGDEVVQTTI